MRSRLVVAVALLLASSACAAALAAPRCERRELPMTWTDGTVTVWLLESCDNGRVTVRPR